MNRLTKRNRDFAFIFGNTAEAIERLAAYEDTGLEPSEIVKIKEERDAAVRDIEGMLHINKTFSLCRFCKRWPGCITFGYETCRPLWRGLKVNIFLNGKFTCRLPYMARNNFGVDGGTAITRSVHKYEETQ